MEQRPVELGQSASSFQTTEEEVSSKLPGQCAGGSGILTENNMNIKNINNIIVLCGMFCIGISTSALAELSANVGVTSNYVWRGVSQTDDGAAVQGGLDYAHRNGVYLGTWASNVDFGGDEGGEVEWDLYGGFGGEIQDFGYDIGVIYYAYPDSDDADFAELTLSGSYQLFEVGLAYTLYSDVEEDAASAEAFIDDDVYYYVNASLPLPEAFTLTGTVGYYDFTDDGVNGNDLSYAHYQVDLTKSTEQMGDVSFSLSQADEESGDDDLKVFVSWTTTFQ